MKHVKIDRFPGGKRFALTMSYDDGQIHDRRLVEIFNRYGIRGTFHLNSASLPTYGMCTDLSRFYTFVNGEFTEFYPERRVVEKFFLATEELHRLNGGKWKDFDFHPEEV